jgi:antirestriction protein
MSLNIATHQIPSNCYIQALTGFVIIDWRIEAMEGKSVIFGSTQDAQKVVEQLSQARIVGTEVFCDDMRALELAIAVANVTGYYYSYYPKGRYPQEEREYNGNNPRIYVRCLSAYTSGFLHGLWIDASQHPNDIQDEINWMLSWSSVSHLESCEEWAIHDYEGFGCLHLSAYQSLETVSKIAKTIVEHGEVLAAYIACEFPNVEEIEDWDELIERFQFAYVGHFESEKDFALSSVEVEELFDFKALEKQFPFWSSHIDWESVAIDLFCGDYYHTKATKEGYGIYVFRNYLA